MIIDAIRNNWGYKVISVILALLLWTYVQNVENPITERPIPVVPKLRNVPPQLYPFWEEREVKVIIRDRKDIVNGISGNDVSAEIDLRDAAEGAKNFPIRVRSVDNLLTSDNGRVEPAYLTVRLEPIESKPKKVDISADPPETTRWNEGGVIVIPSDVTIHGPRSLIASAKVVARVDARSLPVPPTLVVEMEKVPITIENQKGESVPELTCTPAEVKFRGRVTEVIQSRTYPVFVDTTGTPSAGYHQRGGITTEPQNVLVSGNETLLSVIDRIKTEKVDISGATRPINRRVKLLIPEGLRLRGQEWVRVTVPIERDSSGLPTPVPPQ